MLIILPMQILFLVHAECTALLYFCLTYLFLFSSEWLTMSNSFLHLLFYLPASTFELRVETSTSLLEELRQLVDFLPSYAEFLQGLFLPTWLFVPSWSSHTYSQDTISICRKDPFFFLIWCWDQISQNPTNSVSWAAHQNATYFSNCLLCTSLSVKVTRISVFPIMKGFFES